MREVSSGELCKRLKISRSTLREWRKQDGFPEPLEERGARVRWDIDAVYRWRDRRRAKKRNARAEVLRALKATGGNVSYTARLCRVSRDTVRTIRDGGKP